VALFAMSEFFDDVTNSVTSKKFIMTFFDILIFATSKNFDVTFFYQSSNMSKIVNFFYSAI
jgi:hypothetical protein